MFRVIGRFLKNIFKGFMNMFKHEPVSGTIMVATLPIVIFNGPRLAVACGIATPIAFTVALSIFIVSIIMRTIWNYR